MFFNLNLSQVSVSLIGIVSLFLLSATCMAQNSSTSESQIPENLLKAAGSSSSADVDTTKSAPSPEKYVPRPSAEEDASEVETGTQPADPPPSPCPDIPPDLVSPQVQQFLGCDLIQILANPSVSVKSFKVKPVPDTAVPEQERLGDYPIEANGEGSDLNTEQLQALQTLMFSAKSYLFEVEKRCHFRPEMGLYFIKGDEAATVLFSFGCQTWQFVYKDEAKLEDFDPIDEELTQLYQVLFSASDTSAE